MGYADFKSLRVLLANDSAEALDSTFCAVTDLGHEVVAQELGPDQIERATAEHEPDVALVGLHEDKEQALELITEIVDSSACPVIALVEDTDPELIAEAAQRGIFAYASANDLESLRSAIEVGLRRFSEYERLTRAFTRRSVTERAKGILMERHGVDEQTAFEMLRSHARSSNSKLIEIAEVVVTAHGLLPANS